MVIERTSIRRIAVITIASLIGAGIISQIPQTMIGGRTLQTSFLFGIIAGVFSIWASQSAYRDGNKRMAIQFCLLGLGVPLALSGNSPLATLGAAMTVLSAGVAWRMDYRLLEQISGQ
jgi:hypothetical protein